MSEDSLFIIKDGGGEYNVKKDFESLDAWKKTREVKLFYYEKIIPKLPSIEKYNLNVQIRKAAVSITANFAEGYGRFHFQESIQFYRISRGSLYELKDHLITCYDLSYVDDKLLAEGTTLIEEAKKLINGWVNYVRTQMSK